MPLALLAATVRTGAARVFRALAVLTFAVWALYLYVEFVWSRQVSAPIRVDLLFTIPIATMIFSAIGVWAMRQDGLVPKIASAMLLFLSVPTLAVFVHGTWNARRDAARLDTRAALVAEAQFRNPRTFERFFGRIDGAGEPRAGQFVAANRRSYVSRAIVNDRGHAWLMIRCGGTVDCVQWEADLAGATLPAVVPAQSQFGLPRDVVVSSWTRDTLTVRLPPSEADVLVRTPVVYTSREAIADAVTFHGAYSQTRVEGGYAHLTQIWLWQSGDRWLAYYVRHIAPCGSSNEFVHASAYAGAPDGDRIVFTQAGGGGIESFQITKPDAGVPLRGAVMYGGHPLQPLALDPKAVLQSPLYDSAPLADLTATAEWLTTISMGYFLPWRAACPTDRF